MSSRAWTWSPSPRQHDPACRLEGRDAVGHRRRPAAASGRPGDSATRPRPARRRAGRTLAVPGSQIVGVGEVGDEREGVVDGQGGIDGLVQAWHRSGRLQRSGSGTVSPGIRTNRRSGRVPGAKMGCDRSARPHRRRPRGPRRPELHRRRLRASGAGCAAGSRRRPGRWPGGPWSSPARPRGWAARPPARWRRMGARLVLVGRDRRQARPDGRRAGGRRAPRSPISPRSWPTCPRSPRSARRRPRSWPRSRASTSSSTTPGRCSPSAARPPTACERTVRDDGPRAVRADRPAAAPAAGHARTAGSSR